MSIEINMLPVGNGDCIHIRFIDTGGVHNIIIDSGPSTKKRIFRELLWHIYENGEIIDLLCFSHIDDDHIQAAEQIIPEEKWIDSQLIREAWLNVAPSIVTKPVESTYRELTVDSAGRLYRCLVGRKISVVTKIMKGMKFRIGDALLEVLSPNETKHEKYLKYWDREIEKHQMSAVRDPSDTNGDSIALLFVLEGKSLLFLGDAHANVVAESLGERMENENVVLAKLSHHGSKHNISEALLEKMNTRCFLISSSADAGRPSAETFERIEDYKPDKEKQVYCNFTCRFPVKNPDKLQVASLNSKGIEIEDQIRVYTKDYGE